MCIVNLNKKFIFCSSSMFSLWCVMRRRNGMKFAFARKLRRFVELLVICDVWYAIVLRRTVREVEWDSKIRRVNLLICLFISIFNECAIPYFVWREHTHFWHRNTVPFSYVIYVLSSSSCSSLILRLFNGVIISCNTFSNW